MSRAERLRAYWAAKHPETETERALREKRERTRMSHVIGVTPEHRRQLSEQSKAWWAAQRGTR